MVTEAMVWLTLGWTCMQFAATTHTKLSSSNKNQVVQVNSQIKLVLSPVEEPDDLGIDVTFVDNEEVTPEDEVKYIANMTVKELKEYAKSLGLHGYGKMRKSELQYFVMEGLLDV